jgi:multiple sugar transport system permease protein
MDKAKMTLTLALNQLNGQYSTRYNTLMAGSLISMLPILALYASAQKYFQTGLQLGGIKG